ncbi:cyclase [Halomonas sp. ZH2S]|uniref:Cyclase n=1 Tax=Vreelandella zhuhanensis TaxID=2684210 RepID=A0A7X3KQ27_9GAMM|nr:SRPBCC family protein [Halomonas zhuhanensis]MWJ27478.1 cyclase [Halomonas zhuhanensis]
MPIIEHQADIQAEREAVFALVSQVEGFASYSDAIDNIVRLNDDRYLWEVHIAGQSLCFDIEITQTLPPERFAWRSLSGISNQGHFDFTPIEGGTRVHLTLEYHLDNRPMEKAVQLAAKPLLHKLSQDIIRQVECRLAKPPEPKHDSDS